MRIAVFAVPYDAGRLSVGVGLGPARLLEAGLAHQLREAGHEVREQTIELPPDTPTHELARMAAVQRALGQGVRHAVGTGELPIVLAGNCNSAVGTLAARDPGTVIIWFDAHGDFNTAETTVSGMLDGMALSMATGRALDALAASVSGFVPVAEDHVILVGARDLDPAERRALATSPVTCLAPDEAATEIGPLLRRMSHPAPSVYVHLDLDVLDPAYARANQYCAPGGFSPPALARTLSEIAEAAPLYAIAITAYDPAQDPDGRTCRAAIDAVNALVPRPDPGE
jgi:arginase